MEVLIVDEDVRCVVDAMMKEVPKFFIEVSELCVRVPRNYQEEPSR